MRGYWGRGTIRLGGADGASVSGCGSSIALTIYVNWERKGGRVVVIVVVLVGFYMCLVKGKGKGVLH